MDADPTGGNNPFVRPRSNKEFNNLDSEVWRLDAIWDVTDTFSARYAYDNSERDQEPSKAQLTDHVYGIGADVEDNAVEPHISRLRKRLAPHGVSIKTARGLGYMLEATK